MKSYIWNSMSGTVLLSVALFAQPSIGASKLKPFIGFSGGYAFGAGEHHYKRTNGAWKDDKSDSASVYTFGVRVGALEKTMRLYGAYDYTPYPGLSLHNLTGNIEVKMQMARRFYGLLGLHAGYAYGDWNGSPKKPELYWADEAKGSAHGWIAGAQAGMLYRITPSIDIDAGIRVSKVSLTAKVKDKNQYEFEQKLNQHIGINTAVSYRF